LISISYFLCSAVRLAAGATPADTRVLLGAPIHCRAVTAPDIALDAVDASYSTVAITAEPIEESAGLRYWLARPGIMAAASIGIGLLSMLLVPSALGTTRGPGLSGVGSCCI
jgi:hypothetical protein